MARRQIGHREREMLVRLAREHGVHMRQSYTRVGKRALIMQGHCRHTALPNRLLSHRRTPRVLVHAR